MYGKLHARKGAWLRMDNLEIAMKLSSCSYIRKMIFKSSIKKRGIEIEWSVNHQLVHW